MRAASVDECASEGTTPTVFVRETNREVSYEFMTGKRYDSKILYVKEEQQLYVWCASSKSVAYYVCYESKCGNRVYFLDEKCFIAESKPHEHPNQAQMYFNLRALNEIKGILLNGSNRLKARQVFDDVMKR